VARTISGRSVFFEDMGLELQEGAVLREQWFSTRSEEASRAIAFGRRQTRAGTAEAFMRDS
jgi:hypothetical protein